MGFRQALLPKQVFQALLGIGSTDAQNGNGAAARRCGSGNYGFFSAQHTAKIKPCSVTAGLYFYEYS